jgi:putative copper export protein
MGGTIFMRFALVPTVQSLEGKTREDFHDRIRARWSKFVMLASGLLLVSGLANMMLYTSSRYEMSTVPVLGMKYGMIVGIKFLLALPIFLFASFLAGRSATAKKFQANAPFWMNVNLALALVMVLIGGLLKFVQREYKPAPATVSASVASTFPESANQILPLRAAAK